MAETEGEGVGREWERFRGVVHGYVQGVNFRYYTRKKALSLGVKGYVRNRWDGTVEVVAEGRAQALHKLLAWLHTGPRLAQVSQVQTYWEAPRGEFRTFEVRF